MTDWPISRAEEVVNAWHATKSLKEIEVAIRHDYLVAQLKEQIDDMHEQGLIPLSSMDAINRSLMTITRVLAEHKEVSGFKASDLWVALAEDLFHKSTGFTYQT
ncbi:MAG: hypothetical protein OEX12_06155 [Gammaproteobacteria bacterium]|nr:hypothetical protein [Gammaproteobacteria bacterium]